MASLVQQLCQEKRIPAHRAAVVLSPDVAYQRIVELPSALIWRKHVSTFSIRLMVLHCLSRWSKRILIYILCPVSRIQCRLQPYLLIAVPPLIDRVISLLDDAGFELQALELGPFCLLRFLADELIG